MTEDLKAHRDQLDLKETEDRLELKDLEGLQEVLVQLDLVGLQDKRDQLDLVVLKDKREKEGYVRSLTVARAIFLAMHAASETQMNKTPNPIFLVSCIQCGETVLAH